MEQDKKNIAILVLSIALISSGIGNVILSLSSNNDPDIPGEIRMLKVGIFESSLDLDPVSSNDRTSNHIIFQVCEGLYMHNLSDANLRIIPVLAADYGTWDVTGTKFTVPLRRNVFFHDGTPFNAAAVKWNFERINWFTNASGMLNASLGLSPIHSLYEFPNGTTILDPVTPVIINSEYSVTIQLKAPYAILESLLSHTPSYMVSPKSTPKYEYINTENGKTVGTGPFFHDQFFPDREIRLHRWDRYWRTGPYFEEISIIFFDDSSSMNDAFMAQSIDYLLNVNFFMPICGWPEYITVHRGEPSLYYSYLGMNNNKINKTWRQAISYAINYSYMIEEILFITACRSNGPLAPNFPMYDPTIKAASYNLAKARQILVDAGITNLTANNGTTGPVADAWKASNFQSWNYSYAIWDTVREDIGVLLKYNLDFIGINVIEQGIPYNDFFNRVYGYMGTSVYDSLELYWVSRHPDYLSPYNMITSLFSNKSVFNSAQYHNHTIEIWLEEVLSEKNATKRTELYSIILHQIVEVDMPHAFGCHYSTLVSHSTYLKNIPYNSLNSFYVLPMYRDSNS